MGAGAFVHECREGRNEAMSSFARVVFILALLAGAVACAFLLRRGVETDLLELVGGRGTLVAALSEKSSSQIRVLSPDDGTTERIRELFPWADAPVVPASVLELVRTHGRGLLSAKHRAQLCSGETNKIARSAMRRDYSGFGLFPKADDPYYFLNDFVMDLRALEPKLPDGASLVTADVRGHEDRLFGLYSAMRERVSPVLSGAPFHTMLATRSTKFQIGVLGWISLCAVVFVGWRLFGGFRFVLPTSLALGAGFLVGSAAVLLMPGRPHVMTFLFGTTLIGLGVDYCYHAQSMESAGGRRAFLRNLTHALVTTCLAFSPLVFSSVAVLRQMALFTIAGLAAIYCWVVLFGGGGRAGGVVETSATGAGKGAAPWLKAILFIVAAAGLVRLEFGNDPESFYRMDPRMARDEAKIAEVMGVSDSRLALVDLEKWQCENAALKAKMGVEPTGEFLTAADLPRELTLSFEGRDYLVVPASAAFDWGQEVRIENGKWKMENGERGQTPLVVNIIDTKGELAKLFEELAKDANRLLAGSLAVLLVALAVIFRRRVFSYVMPIAAAVIATLGVLGWLGMRVSFFHLVCFFILVGVGIDYVIFHRAGGSSRVVCASFLTSFVGFGALALTTFPITRGMGVTLASGLFFAYVFSLGGRGQENGKWKMENGKRGQTPEKPSANWLDQPQRAAGPLRMWAIFLTYRIFGKSFTKFIAFFIILCVYPWARPVRVALRKFARILAMSVDDQQPAAAGDKPGKCTLCAGTDPAKAFPFKVMLNFAWAMIDKMDTCCFRTALPKITVKGDEGWMKCGCFLLSTHVGCIEVLPAMGGQTLWNAHQRHVHAFQQIGRDAIYTSVFLRHLDRSLMTLHAVEDIGVETAVEMQDAIRRGEIVLMAGDRLPPGASRTAALKHEFLGCECSFPKGVFRFAKLMECPVYAIICVRTGWNAYEVEAKRIGDGELKVENGKLKTGSVERRRGEEAMLSDYVKFLEAAARRYPDQWYQFYDFFA